MGSKTSPKSKTFSSKIVWMDKAKSSPMSQRCRPFLSSIFSIQWSIYLSARGWTVSSSSYEFSEALCTDTHAQIDTSQIEELGRKSRPVTMWLEKCMIFERKSCKILVFFSRQLGEGMLEFIIYFRYILKQKDMVWGMNIWLK